MSMYDIAMANALRNRRRKVIFRGQSGAGVPANALTWNGEVLTWNSEALIWSAA